MGSKKLMAFLFCGGKGGDDGSEKKGKDINI